MENDFLSGALGKAGLLSGKKWSTAHISCRLSARRSFWRILRMVEIIQFDATYTCTRQLARG
jgi:hypothetical protein